MTPAQRHDQILARLKMDGRVSVRELASQFSITEDRIRKDLTALEKRGLLKRIHGGAVPNRENLHRFDIASRLDIHALEKKAIAREAVKLIQEGNVVFLDVSTICLEIAREIFSRHMKVTVVTNMIEIMKIFTEDSPVRPILIGGEFNQAKDGFIGSAADRQIQQFRFDLSFTGSVGIDLETDGVFTYDMTDGLTKKEICRHSKKAWLVAESAKFSQDGNYKYAKLDSFAGLITDASLSQADHKRLEEEEIVVIKAEA